MSTITELVAAWNKYEAAREKAENPNGQFRFELQMTFRAPTDDEYAGYQIVQHGSAEQALKAMQAEGRNVRGDMASISRRTAAIIASAMRRA